MSKLMRGYRERNSGSLASSSDHFVHRLAAKGPSPLGSEYKCPSVVPLEPPHGPDFIALQGMGAVHALFQPPNQIFPRPGFGPKLFATKSQLQVVKRDALLHGDNQRYVRH